MHILGILVFLTVLIVACEVIRQTLTANGVRILEAMTGVAPQAIDRRTEEVPRVVPFKPAVIRPAAARQPERLAA